MVRFTRSGVMATATPDDLQRLRRQFDDTHCVRLHGLMAGDLLRFVRQEIAQGEFADRAHGEIAVEACMQANAALTLLYFLSNDPRFFEFVRQVTGCGLIGSFIGRIYRMVPGAGHYDSWHTDTIGDRMVGMSLNLSPEVYAGGLFQLRERASKAIVTEAPNTGEGDAIIFRIADTLEHQVTPIEGSVAKTAFAGWFVSKPDFLSLLTTEGEPPQEGG
jgi:2-oxoglutarate-Fe(II)-dependent oxygenase superfamily protein